MTRSVEHLNALSLARPEEPVGETETPMAELPNELEDIVGELMEEEEDLMEEADDVTSNWTDSLDKGAGWDAMDGPISNMSAKGVTGNQLPNTSEISGRSGEGRTGQASGLRGGCFPTNPRAGSQAERRRVRPGSRNACRGPIGRGEPRGQISEWKCG